MKLLSPLELMRLATEPNGDELLIEHIDLLQIQLQDYQLIINMAIDKNKDVKYSKCTSHYDKEPKA